MKEAGDDLQTVVIDHADDIDFDSLVTQVHYDAQDAKSFQDAILNRIDDIRAIQRALD